MKKFSGSAISRQQVFTLADGTYVVQWEDKRVQELLSGKYREFDYRADFGHPITDYELKQLRSSGRVEHYNRNYVWLYPLPESGRFGQRRVLGRGNRIRAFYLSTPFAKTQLNMIQSVLGEVGVSEQLSARTRDEVVVILDKGGVPFRTPEDAEQAQDVLKTKSPGLFSELVTAFVETSRQRVSSGTNSEKLNLDDIIASQSNTTKFRGRHIVLAVTHEDERNAFSTIFEEMALRVEHATSAGEVLELLEDHDIDLLITEIELADMHAWSMVGKIKEVDSLRELPIMVLADQSNFSMNVAKVDYILQRPISIAKLRHSVWVALNERVQDENQTPSE
ncbi:MAG: response regulator [Aggregatilineales bacterium]